MYNTPAANGPIPRCVPLSAAHGTSPTKAVSASPTTASIRGEPSDTRPRAPPTGSSCWYSSSKQFGRADTKALQPTPSDSVPGSADPAVAAAAPTAPGPPRWLPPGPSPRAETPRHNAPGPAIQRIGLGALAHGPGKRPHLRRMRHRDRQLGGPDSLDEQAFVSARASHTTCVTACACTHARIAVSPLSVFGNRRTGPRATDTTTSCFPTPLDRLGAAVVVWPPHLRMRGWCPSYLFGATN